jgi:hypothetical protein
MLTHVDTKFRGCEASSAPPHEAIHINAGQKSFSILHSTTTNKRLVLEISLVSSVVTFNLMKLIPPPQPAVCDVRYPYRSLDGPRSRSPKK